MDWWIIIFVIVWVLLQAWILPRMGVSTRMNPDSCRVPDRDRDRTEEPEKSQIEP